MTSARRRAGCGRPPRPDPASAGAGASRSRDGTPRPRLRNGQRARTLVQRPARARHLAVCGTRRSPTHWGMTTAPLRSPVELTPGMSVRARVRTTPLGRPEHGRAGPSRCQAPTGRSTTSRRSGRRSTAEQSQEPHPRPPRAPHSHPNRSIPCRPRSSVCSCLGSIRSMAEGVSG